MNELVEFWNSYPVLVSFSVWITEISLLNLCIFGFIILNFFGLSLTTEINGRLSKMPKHVLTIITLILMFMYPANLLIALIPYGTALLSVIFYQKAVFWYLNLFMPAGNKLKI